MTASNFAVALTQRDLIQDPAVIEEFDRLFARLNGYLSQLTTEDVEGDLDDGIDNNNGSVTTVIKRLDISSDFASFDPELADIISITPLTAARTISGIRGGTDGRRLTIYVPASAAQTLTFGHEAAGAAAAERLNLFGAADIATVAGQARGFDLLYDGTELRWTQVGGSASSGQSAGGGLSAVVEGHTQVGTDADTAEKDLVTGTLPAGTLSAAGDVLIIRAYGNFANTAQGKRLRFYWNGTAVADTNAQGWQDQGWQMLVMITMTGAGAQKGHGLFIPAILGTSNQPGDFFSDTADETGTIAFKITGTNSTAQANDIVFEGWTVYKVSAP